MTPLFFRLWILTGLLTFLSTGGGDLLFAAELSPETKAFLEDRFKMLKTPGAIVVMRSGDDAPQSLAFGEAEVLSHRPVSIDHHFRIGSLSKMFVGTTVLILAGEEKLSLDDPISKFVDGLPNSDKITLRQVGNHRSGLFNHIEAKKVKQAFAAEPQRWWTNEELLMVPRQAPPYFEPGKEHHYSNANTLVLALAIEKVTGRPWGEIVTERVIKPLGLGQTTIPTDNSIPAPVARGYAYGTKEGAFFHRGDVLIDVTDTSPSWWGPAGSMISTASDLAKAIKPLATGKLLSENMREELFHWTPADQKDYEYGFHIERIQKMAIGHDGDVPGYQCCMYYLPEHDASVVVLTNMYGWSIRDMPACRLFGEVVEKGLKVSSTP